MKEYLQLEGEIELSCFDDRMSNLPGQWQREIDIFITTIVKYVSRIVIRKTGLSLSIDIKEQSINTITDCYWRLESMAG